jgi:DNA-binding CsgD family transcriptional regulator
MSASVVGRDVELAALSDFLVRIRDGAHALVLQGDAGMGKTTLWQAGVDEAEAAGLRVLRAEPAESETALSFSGLGDLLDPVLDEALEPLPAGQRSALARALVLEEVEGPPPDAHAVGVALLGALRTLSDARPLLVAVDDAQWLDGASAGALAYAGRRLRSEPVGVVLARRTGLGSSLSVELLRSLGDRATLLEVGPLDASALHRVISDRLGTTLPRPLLAEVQQASGGNPFFAIEIVRMLQRRATDVEAGRPLPVPDSVHDIVEERLLALTNESRRFLLAAAAHAHPTVAITEAASGVSASRGLTEALDAGIVELDGQRIRFTHPLLAAGVIEAADRSQRAVVHARLAELLEDPEARAWQLAACVTQPDASVAAVLEDAAHRARARGAPRPAALLLDRAQELTPPERQDEIVRRAAEAAFLHFESGDSRRAEARVRSVIDVAAPGPLRARALWMLARIRTYEAPAEAVTLFLQLVDEAEDDPAMLAVAHEGVGSSLLWLATRWAEVAAHGEAAYELAMELGDDALAGDALVHKLLGEAWLGSAYAGATAETALALQEATTDRRILDQPVAALVQYWLGTDEVDRARSSLLEMLRRTRELGDESGRPYVLAQLGQVELVLGNPGPALDCALEGLEATDQSGQPLYAGYHLAVKSLVEGRPDVAREGARRALKLIPDGGGEPGLWAASALGHLELARGNATGALSCLGPKVELVLGEGVAEPGAVRFVIDHVEALTEVGRPDEALELLEWYEGNARRLERISALANCARCRGLLAGQARDVEGAIAAFEHALELHARVRLPLDHGRTLLALGAARRRARRRREARATLEEALAVFEEIGAALWAERARAELKRISGRAATPGALTPAEERVAALVCEGKTNREVAAALYLSDRTVEGHLARIFGKLGIRHRTELAGALETQGIELSNTGDSPVSAEPSAS